MWAYLFHGFATDLDDPYDPDAYDRSLLTSRWFHERIGLFHLERLTGIAAMLHMA